MINNKKFHRNKKAELTTQQIVGLIVLIVSFSVILFLIFRLNLGETTNKEICHNSVVLKSKSVVGGALDCRTEYVCITGSEGDECEGINSAVIVNIDMNPKAKDDTEKNEKIKNETMKAIANKMADCWWMFGEGKIDYVGGIHFVGDKACAICSKIVFGSSLKNIKITYGNLYEFMNSQKKDNTQTYLKYLKISSVDSVMGNLSKPFDFSKQHYIVTGIIDSGVIGYVNFAGIPELGVEFNDGSKEKRRNFPPVILEDVSESKCDEFVTKA